MEREAREGFQRAGIVGSRSPFWDSNARYSMNPAGGVGAASPGAFGKTMEQSEEPGLGMKIRTGLYTKRRKHEVDKCCCLCM